MFKLIIVAAMFIYAGPIEDLQPGHWYEIPNSAQSQVWPAYDQFPTVHPGWEECGMDCWCGGAFDTERNRLIFSGGGHGSYWGNEVYVFDLDDLKWYRLNDPTTQLDGNTGGACPIENDKYPCAIHTYDAVDYMPPPVDRYAYMDWNGKPLFLFNQDNLVWEPKSAPPYYGNDERTGAVMAFDPVSGLLFYHECYTSQLSSFNASTGEWKAYGPSAYLSYYYTATIDPVRRKFLATGGTTWNNQRTVVWDISNPSAASIPGTALATTGDTEIESISNPGLEYDPVADKIVAWGGGASVYTLDLDTRVWTKVDPALTNTVTPTAKNQNGTYGRFRYVPSKNVYILANRGTDNIFVYKLTDAATGAPVLKAIADKRALSVAPNPFCSRVTLSVHPADRDASTHLEIFNVQGRIVADFPATGMNGRFPAVTWTPEGLPSSVYVAKLRTGKRVYTEKLLYQR